ncbi:MAG TPA: host attachment protein [Verrucomicrobiae bacterium]|nr:host attachment protein [Verrucomicrobiae bacterium]
MNNKLVVVADRGCLKAYQIEYDGWSTTPRLKLIKEFKPDEATGRISKRLTDEAGRFPGGNDRSNPEVRAFGERHNIELEFERRALKHIAQNINELAKELNAPLYFAATREINQQLVEALAPEARARIEKNVPEDLTKINGVKLLSHF